MRQPEKQTPEIVDDIDAAWRFCGEIFKFVVFVVVVVILFGVLRYTGVLPPPR